MNNMKSQEKRKIEKFLNNLRTNTDSLPEGYLEVHKDKIEWLHWLIASYEGRAGDPKELLESLIDSRYRYEDYLNEMKAHDIEPITEAPFIDDSELTNEIDYTLSERECLGFKNHNWDMALEFLHRLGLNLIRDQRETRVVVITDRGSSEN